MRCHSPTTRFSVVGFTPLAGRIQVQVAVVEIVDGGLLDQVAQHFQIEHEARFLSHLTFHHHIELIVVAVPVGTGAGTKNRLVPGLRPVGTARPNARH